MKQRPSIQTLNNKQDMDSDQVIDSLLDEGAKLMRESLKIEGIDLPLEDIVDTIYYAMHRVSVRLATAEKWIRTMGQTEIYMAELKKLGLD